MDSDLPKKFRERFTKAFEASDFNSQRALSIASGWSESRINRIVTGQFDNSKDGPGFFGLIRSCEQLGVTPDYLAGINKFNHSEQATALNAANFLQSISQDLGAPSIKSLIRTYVRSGHRLEAFRNFLPHCDVYDVPDQENQRVNILEVGEKSLAALRMGEASALVLQEAYDVAPPAFQKQVYESHLRAYELGMTVEPDAIDQRMENRPVHVKIDYIRVAMRLHDANGTERILIYCELIPQ